mmetsp:Transcript_73678/g.204914  ORF Transcript_73678/g.204914 Transcript_73678/m.204914 type:complete len:272 (-) Transcript_73678:142-957(-)
MPAAVTVHVYDLDSGITKGANKVMKAAGTGLYHAGVEVYSTEWSFGCASGIFWCEPKGNRGHSYREAVPMGNTTLSEKEFEVLLDELASEWVAEEYDLLRRNCADFCSELCKRLGVGPVPVWVRSLAGAGAALDNVAHAQHLRAVARRGRRMRGASDGDGYALGDFSRGMVGAMSHQASKAVGDGKSARGVATSEKYKFGDFSRGMCTQVRRQVSRILSDGRAARGPLSRGYKLGDFTRGLIGTFGRDSDRSSDLGAAAVPLRSGSCSQAS